jgi:hypothetical protein
MSRWQNWLPTRNSPYFTLIEPFVGSWEKRPSSLRCGCVLITPPRFGQFAGLDP